MSVIKNLKKNKYALTRVDQIQFVDNNSFPILRVLMDIKNVFRADTIKFRKNWGHRSGDYYGSLVQSVISH